MNLRPISYACFFIITVFYLGGSFASPELSIVTTNIGAGPAHLLSSKYDYNRKVSVRVGDVLTRQAAAVAASTTHGRMHGSMEPRSVSKTMYHDGPLNRGSKTIRHSSIPRNLLPDSSWPADENDLLGQVDVHVFGERINSATLSFLQPSLTGTTPTKLRVILGSDFNDFWMSMVSPSLNNHSTEKLPTSMYSEDLYRNLDALNFTILDDSAEFGKHYVSLNPKEIQFIKKWLVQKAICPVHYVWRDLGYRLWPRWIRHAVCKESSSCSWPSGMHCKPSGSKTLKLLRWYCSKETPEQREIRARRIRSRQARSLYGSAGYAFMQNPRVRHRRQNIGPHSGRRRDTREERRSKRVKRLIRKLARHFNGYRCEWSRDRYTIQPECSCSCGTNN